MENPKIKEQKTQCRASQVVVLLPCACTEAVGGGSGTSHTAVEDPAPSDSQLAGQPAWEENGIEQEEVKGEMRKRGGGRRDIYELEGPRRPSAADVKLTEPSLALSGAELSHCSTTLSLPLLTLVSHAVRRFLPGATCTPSHHAQREKEML